MKKTNPLHALLPQSTASAFEKTAANLHNKTRTKLMNISN